MSHFVTFSTWKHENGNCCIKSDHIQGHSSFVLLHITTYTFRPILPVLSYISKPQSDSMDVLGHTIFWCNQSAPPSASFLCMRLVVRCWISVHCCRLALDESQTWKLYLATLQVNLSNLCPHAVPKLSQVACSLAFPSSLHRNPFLHAFSKTF
jgi:hypothetical protein